jgi:hypothetical protein
MLGWLSVLLMAVSITAIFSCRSLPDMAAGNTIVLTATMVPRQVPAGRGCQGVGQGPGARGCWAGRVPGP